MQIMHTDLTYSIYTHYYDGLSEVQLKLCNT